MAAPEPKITFQASAELAKRLAAQAKREDRSVSAVIRRAVLAYLDRAAERDA